jgi:hypothetical protein
MNTHNALHHARRENHAGAIQVLAQREARLIEKMMHTVDFAAEYKEQFGHEHFESERLLYEYARERCGKEMTPNKRCLAGSITLPGKSYWAVVWPKKIEYRRMIKK